MALVELSVVEQRYQAVLVVINAGIAVAEVARRFEVSRQTVHRWLRRYAERGLGGLADRGSRPTSCPHQIPQHVEAAIVIYRRENPTAGPRTILTALARNGLAPLTSRSSIYRCLVRHRLISPRPRRRKASDHKRDCAVNPSKGVAGR